MCCLDQGGAQPDVARARFARSTFPGAFVVAWTQAYPRRQVFYRRKPAQIDANLRHHDLGGAATKTGDAIDSFHDLLNGLDTVRNFSADLLDQLVKPTQVGELL